MIIQLTILKSIPCTGYTISLISLVIRNFIDMNIIWIHVLLNLNQEKKNSQKFKKTFRWTLLNQVLFWQLPYFWKHDARVVHYDKFFTFDTSLHSYAFMFTSSDLQWEIYFELRGIHKHGFFPSQANKKWFTIFILIFEILRKSS